VHVSRGVVTFTPLPDVPPPVAADLDPLDVRVVVTWCAPGDVEPGPGLVRVDAGDRLLLGETRDVSICATDRALRGNLAVARRATLTQRGETAEVDLADPVVRRLALAAAQLQAGDALPVKLVDLMGGGSGI
jgi:hypothetical protein